jgi:hypothetical protein
MVVLKEMARIGNEKGKSIDFQSHAPGPIRIESHTCCVGLGVLSEPRELSVDDRFESRHRADDSFDNIDEPSP